MEKPLELRKVEAFESITESLKILCSYDREINDEPKNSVDALIDAIREISSVIAMTSDDRRFN